MPYPTEKGDLQVRSACSKELSLRYNGQRAACGPGTLPKLPATMCLSCYRTFNLVTNDVKQSYGHHEVSTTKLHVQRTTEY